MSYIVCVSRASVWRRWRSRRMSFWRLSRFRWGNIWWKMWCPPSLRAWSNAAGSDQTTQWTFWYILFTLTFTLLLEQQQGQCSTRIDSENVCCVHKNLFFFVSGWISLEKQSTGRVNRCHICIKDESQYSSCSFEMFIKVLQRDIKDFLWVIDNRLEYSNCMFIIFSEKWLWSFSFLTLLFVYLCI